MSSEEQTLPPQHQEKQPGIESQMTPRPEYKAPAYKAAGKLKDKVAIITGGDSGIGRAVAVLYAKEGADVAIVYKDEHSDAEETKKAVEQEGRKCILLPGDIGDESFAKQAVEQTVSELGKLDIVVNNAAEQHVQQSIVDITAEQLERTFRTNIFGMFFITKAAVPHLKEGSTIINTTSVTAYRGEPVLLDYSSTKGAITAFTRALSMNIVEKGIRVNAVAPGPIWTPLIPASFDEEKVSKFGASQPMKRPGQPEEVAPAYVYLASTDSSYVSGQIIHVNGGEIING
ncbi:NAD(P)-dependent dehydrogenase (short-subunit alcohol dehydrogenase family) [Paenibacillus sp. SORGH_AS306]|uniref:SDR family oxidoreductase n=1 Tax=unclassified Paenibacillus TaxID=185978 RepID=UPI0027840999|nr:MULTISPECIES: SDR family oxidoreductase [unclassified Paenibacillus]MDQ1233373.1 NAD(P)-dependent dehydrogenase (short-subunit alcohol dehydrogenase family) [Paenibacillus sp. SORGH_AS_0306]MDR6110414.1 NAD(P)-dependent dehydrogenase (short-subunit alcohol dehydrogenase family) [Paenibacillus sp. SORGH_AS_0338]